MAERSARFADFLESTRIYAVTDDSLSIDRLLETVDALLGVGIRIFQYREKSRPDRDRVEIGRRLAARVHAAGGLLLVNDRVDIALACGADGAHLGQDDLPLVAGRALLGPELLLGASASYLEEIEPAIAAGIDYLGFGAMFATDTKTDAEYAGLEMLARVCEIASVPVVGIGGITLERAPSVIERGADAVAVVSALFRADDPTQASSALLAAVGRQK
jgi:thiamine-phosphate diphosphorylase